MVNSLHKKRSPCLNRRKVIQEALDFDVRILHRSPLIARRTDLLTHWSSNVTKVLDIPALSTWFLNKVPDSFNR